LAILQLLIGATFRYKYKKTQLWVELKYIISQTNTFTDDLGNTEINIKQNCNGGQIKKRKNSLSLMLQNHLKVAEGCLMIGATIDGEVISS
jgi:hypothetical protein